MLPFGDVPVIEQAVMPVNVGYAALPMQVSLILCTRNGGERLQTCLKHIEALDAPDDLEVVLVDNGSTDGFSYELAQNFGRGTRFKCRVLQTFIPGNAAGRNYAVENCSGTLLIFIDDDCYPDPQLVREWTKVVTEYHFGYASGMVRRFSLDQSDLGCTETVDVQLMPPGHFVHRGFIQGSNMVFTRECLRVAGPFDVRFGSGTPFAGEEWDVALKASYAGWLGGYFPWPIVDHDHRRKEAESRERNLYYSYGAGAVYAKHCFGKNGLKIARRFIRELRGYADRENKIEIVRGYVDFLLGRQKKLT